MRKRGQLTIFIIIGLVFVLLIAALVYFNTGDRDVEVISGLTLPPDLLPVKTLVDSCLSEALPSAVFILASKGGYIVNAENILETEYVQPAYHLILNQDVSPRIAHMETELEGFIQALLPLCIDDFNAIEALTIENAEITVDATIAENEVFVTLDYPVTVLLPEGRTRIKEFTGRTPLRLGHLIAIKNDILPMLQASEFVDLGQLASYDVEVDVLPYSSEDIIFTIIDDIVEPFEAPLVFNFAVKIDSNSPPDLAFIPDFVIEQGNSLEYTLEASDPDGDPLFFFAEKGGILVDSRTGELAFASQSAGQSQATLCVRDQFREKDCRDVQVTVK